MDLRFLMPWPYNWQPEVVPKIVTKISPGGRSLRCPLALLYGLAVDDYGVIRNASPMNTSGALNIRARPDESTSGENGKLGLDL